MKTLDISTPGCPNAIVMVDDDDWDFVRRLSFTPARHGNTIYAICYGAERVYLHRQIARARVTEDVDHKDGNGLNCQKENLRRCTKSQNGYNRVRRHGNSQYLGVHKLKGQETWLAYLTVEKKRLSLGRFKNEEAAARARDAAAVQHQGEFARLNFPSA